MINPDVLPVETRGSQARKTGSWTLDLGGIAKGYAVDCAVDSIRRLTAGMNVSGSISAGGDLRVWGEDDASVMIRVQRENSLSGSYPMKMSHTAAATSSVRQSSDLETLSAAAHVQMPSGDLLRETKTVTVFADRCVLADALTKIVLLGSADMAARCLSSYQARALVFGSDGRLEKALS